MWLYRSTSLLAVAAYRLKSFITRGELFHGTMMFSGETTQAELIATKQLVR
jgi:hypothetical protein